MATTNNYSGFYYAGLKYSTREVNMNFKIKVSGINDNGEKLHKLVGVQGLLEIIGDSHKVNNLLDKAFDKGLDKFERRLRRGLKVVFYSNSQLI